MTLLKKGTEVEVTITYLEMTARPGYDRPSVPLGPPTALIAAESPPVWYFFDLYDAVGAPYEWTGRHAQDPEDVRAFVEDPKVVLYTLIRAGWPHGFFMLDFTEPGEVDLAYFGLVPEAVGRGLGEYLLKTAVHLGWDGPAVEKMVVNTCTLDHPRALGLYQKCGFSPVEQETEMRVLTRDREMALA